MLFSRSLMVMMAAALLAAGQTADQPRRAVTDPGVVTTRQTITPAGVPAVFDGRVYGVAFGASAEELWVLNQRGLYRFDWRKNRVLDRVQPAPRRAGLQGVAFDGVTRRALYTGTSNDRDVWVSAVEAGKPVELRTKVGKHLSGTPAIAPKANVKGERLAVVPLVHDNLLAVIDLNAASGVTTVATGIAPFGAVVNDTGETAWVSNWGGRVARAGDRTAPTGLLPGADRVVVDERGIAATGTVTKIDLLTRKAMATVETGLHPTALAWDQGRHRLFVANNNGDSITVIDTAAAKVVNTWKIEPFEEKAPGLAPSALALTPDGRRLLVALGGINAVALLDAATGRVEGMIPTGWYPSALAMSGDGTKVAVGSLLGAGSGWRDQPNQRFVHSYRGSVAVVDMPDAAQLANYTNAVAENTRLTLAGRAQLARRPAARNVRPKAIPERAGEPSLIEHVVYIVKENRTYDQVLGALPQGNGDPSLVMFGREVTPNQHKLAEDYVLLDNFYATGGNSGDGHQWVTQANETAYCLWPGYEGRSYPFDGTDPIAYAQGGFLWDAALRAGKTVRVYGEYAGRLTEARPTARVDYFARWRKGDDFTKDFHIVAPIDPLNKILAANYPTYTNAVPDVVRASIFLEDVKKWNAANPMPNLVILQLPSDHTFGATPNASTPRAMVADNDLALGQIIEGLSKTPFWRKMAVFVVEDDAQNGVDHVDGHRTTAFVASPYARRGQVDSTFYANQSITKTIGLILGLPALSLFELIANDMRASFQDTPEFGEFAHVVPEQSLDDLNPAVQALRGEARRAALDSEKMRWDVPDAAPTERVNRILWGMLKGWKTPYPGAKSTVFAPLSLETEDEDREMGEEK
jgi:YVTN family beta-propeller protein